MPAIEMRLRGGVAAAALLLTAPSGAAQQPTPSPPNAPARFDVRNDSLIVSYGGATIFRATISGRTPATRTQSLVDSTAGVVTQVLKLTSFNGTNLVLRGEVSGSDEAFPVEADRREDGLPLVRHASGLSTSRLNRAVYDRQGDWLLSIDFPARVRVVPTTTTGSSTRFAFEASGTEIGVRFRPRFYQRHRGLAAFEPWTYRLKRDVPAGWTSWYAFFDRVTENDVHRVADVMAERLAPFGYRYLQLDDGYQRLPIGTPGNWLGSNDRFPSGMEALAGYVASRGLTPAIWTNVAFHDSAWALSHPTYFVRDTAGRPVWGNWIGFVLDGANPAVATDLLSPVYRSFRTMGYDYFKLDALRHLRYEGYNSNTAWFASRGLDRSAVFRDVVRAVRAAIGADAFLLACWGVRPELIGLVDAVRVGDDGFGYGGLAQFNSFNNVVWRNDPDHIELSKPDAWASTMATTLTGSHFMLTDKPELYHTSRVEIARRAAPVLFTLPGQVYDVDPERSARLSGVDSELSGAGPRPFDGDQTAMHHLYLLDIARSYEHWAVLGRTADAPRRIPLAELGLDDSLSWLAFDFWEKRLIGTMRDTLVLAALDPVRRAQVVCLRARLARPQVVATSRHLTCGGTDLVSVSFADNRLSGESDIVAADEYRLYLREPAGFHFRALRVEGAAVTGNALHGGLRVIHLRSATSGRVRWSVDYAH